MSRPHGPWMRSSVLFGTPASSSRSRRRACAAAAERADVEGLRLQRGLQRREVELLVVGQDDDRGVAIGANLRERLFGPLDDDLVGARHPLGRREAAARIDADRAPAERSGGGAESFAGVDRADHDEARRRPEDLGEDLRALRARPGRCGGCRGQAPPGRRGPRRGLPAVEQNDQLRAGGGPSITVKTTARSSPCASESRTSVRLNRGARRTRRSRRRRAVRR